MNALFDQSELIGLNFHRTVSSNNSFAIFNYIPNRRLQQLYSNRRSSPEIGRVKLQLTECYNWLCWSVSGTIRSSVVAASTYTYVKHGLYWRILYPSCCILSPAPSPVSDLRSQVVSSKQRKLGLTQELF